MSPGVVILGAGHAGVELCAALRARGCDLPITLVEQQAGPPYERPPLSKGMLGGNTVQLTPLKSDGFYREMSIRRVADTALSIDRERRVVTLASGEVLTYDVLVLATGASARRISQLPHEAEVVHELRTAEDARRLLAALTSSTRVAIIGAGFIGLEVASIAVQRCARVIVLEAADRALARAVSPELSRVLVERHRADGVEIRLGETLSEVSMQTDGSVILHASSGDVEADVVLVGVGVIPRIELAQAAGIVVDDGIVVDSEMRTSDSRVFAIGDVASFPGGRGGAALRLESVPNAADHARHVAATICGDSHAARALPWFWSIQGGQRVQIVGVATPDDNWATGASRREGGVVVLRHRDGLLHAVETINDPGTHVIARKLLANGPLPMCDVSTVGYDLHALSTPLPT